MPEQEISANHLDASWAGCDASLESITHAVTSWDDLQDELHLLIEPAQRKPPQATNRTIKQQLLQLPEHDLPLGLPLRMPDEPLPAGGCSSCGDSTGRRTGAGLQVFGSAELSSGAAVLSHEALSQAAGSPSTPGLSNSCPDSSISSSRANPRLSHGSPPAHAYMSALTVQPHAAAAPMQSLPQPQPVQRGRLPGGLEQQPSKAQEIANAQAEAKRRWRQEPGACSRPPASSFMTAASDEGWCPADSSPASQAAPQLWGSLQSQQPPPQAPQMALEQSDWRHLRSQLWGGEGNAPQDRPPEAVASSHFQVITKAQDPQTSKLAAPQAVRVPSPESSSFQPCGWPRWPEALAHDPTPEALGHFRTAHDRHMPAGPHTPFHLAEQQPQAAPSWPGPPGFPSEAGTFRMPFRSRLRQRGQQAATPSRMTAADGCRAPGEGPQQDYIDSAPRGEWASYGRMPQAQAPAVDPPVYGYLDQLHAPRPREPKLTGNAAAALPTRAAHLLRRTPDSTAKDRGPIDSSKIPADATRGLIQPHTLLPALGLSRVEQQLLAWGGRASHAAI